VKVAILDYGAGNLHSLAKAVTAAGVEVAIENDPARAVKLDALLLPGVGAFASATEFLAPHREQISDALRDGLPCLGICLGMQLLFDESEEGPGEGLGVIHGQVRKLAARHVPQIGWNEIEDPSDPLFDSAPIRNAYFANSYVCEPEDQKTAIAWATHENDRFVAAVRSGSVVGVQFHPEKSSTPGCGLVRAFLESARR
jgi:imidazole glycerol-phosphate synthase subunit HisH